MEKEDEDQETVERILPMTGERKMTSVDQR